MKKLAITWASHYNSMKGILSHFMESEIQNGGVHFFSKSNPQDTFYTMTTNEHINILTGMSSMK
jgi:hypothetical protein